MFFRGEWWVLVLLVIMTYLSWRFRKKKQRKTLSKPKIINRKASEKFYFTSVCNFGAFFIICNFALENINFQLLQPWTCGSENLYSISSIDLKDFYQLGSNTLVQKQFFYDPKFSVFTNTKFSKFSNNYYEKVDTSKFLSKSPASFIWSSTSSNFISLARIYFFDFRSTPRNGSRDHTKLDLAPNFTNFGHIYVSPRPVSGNSIPTSEFFCHRSFLISSLQRRKSNLLRQEFFSITN